MNFSTSNISLSVFFIAIFTLSFQSHSNAWDLNNLPESNNLVKAGSKYITLLGQQVNVGEQAPQFKVVDKNFTPVSLKDFHGQTLLISVVPSLDTGVCSIQTKRFNEEAAKLPKNITLLTISNDLPFAQKRFCDVEKIDSIKVLSDSVWREFGVNYGLLIKDMGLLTRAIFVIDNQGKIVYKELVANISQYPNYDKALAKVKFTAPVIVIDGPKINTPSEPMVEK
ncbi:thiol peroxidase [Colwellia piezophila]|uniref:thiol peroxidase n=1 Tax=Colwellia piezophila TaxID=211668 RepID=UPI00035CE205|nr:thiol peroxidase [Colwellia piezophila]